MSNTNTFDNYNLILNNKLKVPQDYSIKDIYKITDKILNLNYDDSNLEIQLEYLFIELIRNKDLPLSDKIGFMKLIKNGGQKIKKKGKMWQDWDYWLRMLEHADCLYINEPLVYYDLEKY